MSEKIINAKFKVVSGPVVPAVHEERAPFWTFERESAAFAVGCLAIGILGGPLVSLIQHLMR